MHRRRADAGAVAEARGWTTMRRTAWTMAGLLAVAGTAALSDDEPKGDRPAAKAASPAPQADERAIRELVAAFTRAYNEGDAAAVARLFADDARVEQEDGTILEGRDAIEESFAGSLGMDPRPTIALEPERIQFLSADVASEEGRSTVRRGADGEGAEAGRYEVLYVKRDGKWLHARVRELASDEGERPPYDHLKELEWMVGEWVAEGGENLAQTTCAWADNKCYLVRDFTIRVSGLPAMTGTQRIGWDPLRKQIRSWLFDSQGGFAEGFWSRDGDRWVVKLNGVSRDGRAVTGTQIVTSLGRDASLWTMVDRTRGDEAAADIDEFRLVRRPPGPGRNADRPAPKAGGGSR